MTKIAIQISANLFLILISIFLMSCSVYKSEGRKKFENDIVTKVNVEARLNCYSTNPIEYASDSQEITPSGHHIYIYTDEAKNIAQLSIHSPNTLDYCLTPELNLNEFNSHQEKLYNLINNWP